MSMILILLLNLLVGACIGLTGIAGFLLPMFYTGFLGMPAGESLALSFSAFLISGALGSVTYYRQGNLDLKPAVILSAGSLPGALAGPGDPGLLPAGLRHAGVLAGDPAAFDLRRMAGLAAGGTFSAGGDGRCGGYCRRPAPACHTPRTDIEHYRRGEYRAPHEREDDRRHGIELCTLRPGAGRIRTLRHPAPWSAQCGSSGDHTAVCVCQ